MAIFNLEYINKIHEATVEELKAKQEELKKKMAKFDQSYDKMNQSANKVVNKISKNKSDSIFNRFRKN